MKRRILAFTAVLFVIFFLAGPVQAQKMGFRFKFNGGYGTLNGGDANAIMDDSLRQLEDFEELFNYYYSGTATEISGDVKKFGKGTEFGGEAILTFGSFGVGGGLDYITRSANTELSFTLPDYSGYNWDINHNGSLKALALMINFYAFLGKAPLNIYVYGGPGFYFGTATWDAKYVDNVFYYDLTSEYHTEVTGTAIGFQGGLGVEFDLAKNFAIFLEGKGRFCKINNWSGDMTGDDAIWGDVDESGKLWYVEGYTLMSWLYTDEYYAEGEISEDEPDGTDDYQNVRPFEAILTGFSIRVGICIKF